MSASNYTAALKRVLVHEGGFSDHPRDPGGATMKGVTQKVYDAYRRRHGFQTRSVRLIEDAELQAIYRTQYADDVEFDKLPDGIDYVVFDGAANSGPSQSVKWLQRALGVTADGIVGNVTLQKAQAYPNKSALVDAICDQRMKFLKQLKTWNSFGKGWTSRVTEVRRVGKQMAAGNAPHVEVVADASVGLPRAMAVDAAKPVAPIVAPTVAAAIATAAAAVATAKDALTPMIGTSAFVGNIYTVLISVGAVIGLAGAAYGVYAKFRSDKVKAAIGPVT